MTPFDFLWPVTENGKHVGDLIRENYYNPAYEPEKLVTHESNI